MHGTEVGKMELKLSSNWSLESLIVYVYELISTSNSVHVTLTILTGMKVNDLSMTPGAFINQFTHRPESEI
jgi:hypothetical protein